MRWPGENTYDALIGPRADAAGLDVALVKAIIGHESQFIARAYHYDGPDYAVNASYGLMQVEGVTARFYGFTGDFAKLYDPATNLDYGIRRLKEALQRQGGDVARAVSDYNGGNRPSLGYGTPLGSGKFANQSYVDDVLRNLDYFRALVAPPEPPPPDDVPAPVPAKFSTAELVAAALLVLGLAAYLVSR